MSIRDTGTEKLIKDTAKRVFFAEGKLHATTQDIADAAGISRTSLHYYYRSRDELLKQVFNEASRELSDKQYELMNSKLPFKEKIEKMVALFITETIAFPYRETFLITEMIDKNVELNKMKEEGAVHIKSFMKEIEKEMKAGRIKQMKPVQFLMNMFALTSHPLLMRPISMSMFNLSEKQFNQLVNERKQLIVDMIFN